MTQFISLVMAILTLFSSVMSGFGSIFKETEPETTYTPTEIEEALEEFENSLYGEDGTYIYDAMRTEFANGFDMTSAIYGSTPDVPVETGVITIEITSKMLFSALSKIIPTDKIVTFLKEEFLGDTTAKYKGFLNSASGALYIFEQFKQIDNNFRELTNLVNKTELKNQLADRNKYIDSLTTVNDAAWAGVVSRLNNLDDETTRAEVKELVYKWGVTPVNGNYAKDEVINLMKGITDRTEGKTYPELYDEFARYIFDWEMESYEYRETARLIDMLTLTKGYILTELYYTLAIEDEDNSAMIDSHIASLNALYDCMNNYKNTMDNHKVQYKNTTECYIFGAEGLVVSKNIVHFDYATQLYDKRYYYEWGDDTTILNTFKFLHNCPYSYFSSDFVKRYTYTTNFKYVDKSYYETIAKYYKSKGTNFVDGLLAAGFTGISHSSAFVYAEEADKISTDSDGLFWAYVKLGNIRIKYCGIKSNHDHLDIYSMGYDGSMGWREAANSFNMNVTSNDAKHLSHWDTANNLAYNRTSNDFCSFIPV